MVRKPPTLGAIDTKHVEDQKKQKYVTEPAGGGGEVLAEHHVHDTASEASTVPIENVALMRVGRRRSTRESFAALRALPLDETDPVVQERIKIGEIFTQYFRKDGTLSVYGFAALMQKLDNERAELWSTQRLATVMEAIGVESSSGVRRIRIDDLIRWVFGIQGQTHTASKDSNSSAKQSSADEDPGPNSPKVVRPARRVVEKRAYAYQCSATDRIYRPQSHPDGLLLLRADRTFSYVHNDQAKFSEGVQGVWSQTGHDVILDPQSFGYCYQESFDAHEIIGVRHTVSVVAEACVFHGHLLTHLSWLDPTKPELECTYNQAAVDFGDEECPNSPKVPSRISERRHTEKRANRYVRSAGEMLFRPQSRPKGVLLLQPNMSFSYVHDDCSRFSEGVQGVWTRQGNQVTLTPTGYGYCFEEEFDANEIIGVGYTVTVSDQMITHDASICTLPDELLNRFSWLDPTLPEDTFDRTSSQPMEDDVCPNSPKVPGRVRRHPEKRAHAHELEVGEQLYRPQSLPSGLLLLRMDGTFAYVHNDLARFSEGVQGTWTQVVHDQVMLLPKSFGYCYEESFDKNEIVGVEHTVTLCADNTCVFPAELLERMSWLDPTLAEGPPVPKPPVVPPRADDDECPNSPKVPGRGARRGGEKRAFQYSLNGGEELYRPQSHKSGCLLLRSDATFAYVHHDEARFSEGVQGTWTRHGNQVTLRPTSFGYCYQEAFDTHEIVGICHTVTCLGGQVCVLPEELLHKFSWLDPTLPEAPADPGFGGGGLFDEEECPNSPKVPKRLAKRDAERRAFAYKCSATERIYRPRSNPSGALLLRNDFSFAYVHNDQARFSEGVQGVYRKEGNEVVLDPQSYGWCYQESFDNPEIIGVCHRVTLLPGPGQICCFPDELTKRLSWLDPSLPDADHLVAMMGEGYTDVPPQMVQFGQVSVAGSSDFEDSPNSPKVPSRKRRSQEKRANAYQLESGEALYRPESRKSALLLLRPKGQFSYVHDEQARFSEGVQGTWSKPDQARVELVPTSFGYCYQETFDVNEIVGVAHIITLQRHMIDENGIFGCTFPPALTRKRSWLDPTLPEDALVQEEEQEQPVNSPKVPVRISKRKSSKNTLGTIASRYECCLGERMFRPESHPNGLLLLKSSGLFAYVHDDTCRFADGVQGEWFDEVEDRVKLSPTSFGFSYEESFDANEIVGVCHSLTLTKEAVEDNTNVCLCRLPDQLLRRLSWLDPTLPE